MQLSFNIADFILLALALQGFILSGLLFYSSKDIVSNRWLGALVFIVSEATVIMELDYSGIFGKYPILQLIILHFILATGPIIYFYTQSLLFPDRKLTLKSWLNFAPVLLEMKYPLIYLLYISGLLSVSFVQNIYFTPAIQQMLFGSFPLTTILGFISVIIYSIITYATITRYQKSTILSVYKLKDIKWIKNLLRFIFAFAVIWFFSIVTGAGNSKYISRSWDHYILYIPAIVFVYLLGMMAWRRQNAMPANEIAEYIQKPSKIYFNAEEADSYARQLTELMNVKRIYLDPLLKVEDVAANMSIPEKSLSSLLNQHIGKNFNDYVNEYRIAEVKARLTDPVHNNFTIAAIAFDCGFNSLATFQRVFKQFTGTTPSKFQNNGFSLQQTDQMILKSRSE